MGPASKNNIAEYILFMWQTEDLIRACQFDANRIREVIATNQGLANPQIDELKDWYLSIAEQMMSEGVQNNGHISDLHAIIQELFYLHNTLINVLRDEKYIGLFKTAEKFLKEYKAVTDGNVGNSIEMCLTALYGKLLLRIKGEDISPETEEAMQSFTHMMAYLSNKYDAMKSGSLDFSGN